MTKRFFFDCEFIEGFKKPINWLPSSIGNFNKPYHSIQLITIGIVADDGREYYAVSNEFNPDDANEWVRENIFARLLSEHIQGLQGIRKQLTLGCIEGKSIESNMRLFQGWFGKSNQQIAKEILQFVAPYHFMKNEFKTANVAENQTTYLEKFSPEFYAYFADYDWVLLCSLFGNMSELPTGFPNMCFDIQQMIVENNLDNETLIKKVPQINEHNALSDAKWSKLAYEYIMENKV